MPNIKRYNVSFDGDIEIEMRVDLDKLTIEIATEMNSFWSGSNDLLNACDGDVIRCAIRLIAAKAADFIAQNSYLDSSRFKNEEGYYSLEEIGVEITDYCFPEWSAWDARDREISNV